MEQMIANGIQLIKTDSSYNFTGDTVNYRHQIPFVNQKNLYDASICEFAQPIDFNDVSVLQFLTTEASVTCEIRDYTGALLDTIPAINVGAYDTQNVFNLEIDWSTIIGNLEHCYLQINDGTEYFRSEPLRSIDQRAKIKLRYRMLRNHKNIGYFFNTSNESYEFFHILYLEAELTDFQRVNDKSVFKDSNQTLINLFATFRHSFLCRTWQVAYYLYEKVNTLSYCDEIYLSETKQGNTYEGRVFLGEDEFAELERIEETNLYVSSTRFVTNDAFRLVGAAQETPLVTEPNLGIVPIHHTNPNGNKGTFQTPYKLLTSKLLYTPQGLPSEYLFKVGDNTAALRNAHDVGWDALPSLTFSEFSALTINADSYVQVRYTGSLEQTHVVAALHTPVADAPINPSTRGYAINSKTALSDMVIYPNIITGFDSVGFTTGSAQIASAQRDFDDLTNGTDLTDFVAGITNLPIPIENGIGHLHLQRTNLSALSVSITSNQANPKNEIIAYCNPLGNIGYPTTGNGTNPNSIEGDAVNDKFFAPAGATGADLLYPELMAVGEERTYTFLGQQFGLGFYAASTFSFIRDLGNSNALRLNFQSGIVGALFENADSFTTGNSLVRYFTMTIKRTALTGSFNDCFEVEFFGNGKKLEILSTTGTISNSSVPHQGVQRYNLGMLNGLADQNLSNSFRNKGARYFAVHKKILTKSEIDALHHGKETSTTNPNYYYDFTNLVVNGSDRLIPNLGSDAIDDVRLENHTNILTPLYP